MAEFYNPHLLVSNRKFYLPVPVAQIDTTHKWKGKYHHIPLGMDILTGRVGGSIDFTLSGIVCVDWHLNRLTEPGLWDMIYYLQNLFEGGRKVWTWSRSGRTTVITGCFDLIINETSPRNVYQVCFCDEFSYAKPETKTQYIPWSAKITCLYPIVLG